MDNKILRLRILNHLRDHRSLIFYLRVIFGPVYIFIKIFAKSSQLHIKNS